MYPYELDEEFDISDETKVVFESFQRPEIVRFQHQLEAGWEPRAIGTVTVSNIEGDTWSIIDGGQRIRAARRLGYLNIPACVHRQQTYDQRAELFLLMDHRTKLTPFDVFTAKLERRDGQAMAVKRITEEQGYEVVNDKVSVMPNRIRAVSTLMRIVTDLGEMTLRETLRLGKIWIPQEVLKIDLLAGLATYVHGKDGATVAQLIQQLNAFSLAEVSSVVAKTADNAGRGSGGSGGRWAKVFTDIAAGRMTQEMVHELNEQVRRVTTVSSGELTRVGQ